MMHLAPKTLATCSFLLKTDFMRHFVYSFCLLICFALSAFPAGDDPLAHEIARWKNFLETNKSDSENWVSIRDSSLPLIERAENALKADRRNLAIHILAAIRTNLAAQKYVQEHHVTPATELSALEKEWGRVREDLQSPEQPVDFERLPASVRAVGEAAFSEIKVYYDASLEYGKNTMPEYGFFYIGLSQAQLEFAGWLKQFETQKTLQTPKLSGLNGQIDELEDQLLSAYKPPASIEQHPNFIRASGLIKHAHELKDAGLEYGALYRILYARQILSKITSPGKSIASEEALKRTNALTGRLNDSKTDHSLGRMFVELANEEPYNGETARTVFEDILPIYFSSFEPSKEQVVNETPAATVTLVRWPYT
jgi:hypothetical protein